MTRALYEQEVRQHLLALRECLVRHDENIKAHTLLAECVPYFLRNDEVVMQQAEDQRAMTAHMRDEAAYADYYGNNPHELPFEEMFGGEVADLVAAGKLIRISWLIEELNKIKARNVLDVACNDGAIAHYVGVQANVRVCGLDLNPDCIARAKERGINALHGTIEDISTPYDAVYAMEVIEHVPDPTTFLTRLAARAPHVFISTPFGATEMGNVPGWATVEYKGHVRAVTPEDVKMWADDAGLETDFIGLTTDNIICAHYSHAT